MISRLLVVRRLLPSLLLAAAVHAVGCGGAKQAEDASYAPSPAQQPEYAQPQSQTGQAQGQYPQPGAIPRGVGGEKGGDDGMPPPPPPTPAPLLDKTGTTERDLSTLASALSAFEEDEIRLGEMLDDETIQLAQPAVCDRVCDALASMRRSADAICELAGDDDDRCGKARGTLQTNETRVNDSGCRCS